MIEEEPPEHPRIADVRGSIDRAVEEIEAEPDPDLAFRYANQLWALLRHYIDTVIAALRRRIAERIRDAHSLSLAALGDRIGISGARLSQMGVRGLKGRRKQDTT